MKRALVLSLVALFAFGVASFGQLTGYWSTNIAIDPDAGSFGAFFTGLGSTLSVDYALSDWTFGSLSSFDRAGFSAQKFSVGGALGAFTLASNMYFDPAFITEKTYTVQSIGDVVCPLAWTATGVGPQFLKWDVTGSVSIAGVSFEAKVLQNYGYTDVLLKNYLFVGTATSAVQTDAKSWTSGVEGMGWRLKIAGSFGGVSVTSYTYFNMTEAEARTTYGLSIAKRGTLVVQAGCDFDFVEEYVLIEGFTFGCVTLDIAVEIDCTGFDHIAFLVKDISIGGFATFDFQITFTTSSKSVATDIQIVTPVFDCIVLEIGFGGSAVGLLNGGNVIDAIYIHGFKLVQTWNGLTFTSITELDAASMLMSTSSAYSYIYNPATALGWIPYLGETVAGTTYHVFGDGLYEAYCYSTERYLLWEKFVIDVDADACCGGLFDLTVATYFGDHYTLTELYYATVAAGSAVYANYTAIIAGSTLTAITDLTTAATYAAVKVVPTWTAGNTTLFDWAKTSVDLGVGVGANIALTFGFDVSAFGWESLDVGFKWSF